MTIQDWITDYLVAQGQTPEEAEESIGVFKQTPEGKQVKWHDDVSGYPAVLKASIVFALNNVTRA